MTSINRLVRDKVPEDIKRYGGKADIRTLENSEFKEELKKLLITEVKEYLDNDSTEELIDILEIVYSLGSVHNLSFKEMVNLRKRKVEQKGSYSKKLFLGEEAKAEVN